MCTANKWKENMNSRGNKKNLKGKTGPETEKHLQMQLLGTESFQSTSLPLSRPEKSFLSFIIDIPKKKRCFILAFFKQFIFVTSPSCSFSLLLPHILFSQPSSTFLLSHHRHPYHNPCPSSLLSPWSPTSTHPYASF